MKLTFLLLSFFISCVTIAQEGSEVFTKAVFKDSDTYFENNLPYPRKLMRAKEDAGVILSFKLNERGVIDSIDLYSATHDILVDQAVQTLLAVRSSWEPTKVDGIPVAHWYKLVIYYNMIGEVTDMTNVKTTSETLYDTAEKLYSKRKFEKALDKITEALLIQPYQSHYFDLRSKIYLALDKEEEAKNDELASRYMYMDVMTVVNINVAYMQRSEIRVNRSRGMH